MPAQVNTLQSHTATPQLHTTHVVSSCFDSGSRSGCECRRASTPRKVAAGGAARSLPGRGLLFPSRSPGSPWQTGSPWKRGVSSPFFLSSGAKSPLPISFTPILGYYSHIFPARRNIHSTNNVATSRLTPRAEQQAHSARSKHQLGLIRALATTGTVTRSEEKKNYNVRVF